MSNIKMAYTREMIEALDFIIAFVGGTLLLFLVFALAGAVIWGVFLAGARLEQMHKDSQREARHRRISGTQARSRYA